ncbi:MAG: cupin domain-containing protein [Streptosporangiales bacterium]|nr:cupin domain-containing protein [Streptosporangiales bacterium]
MATTGAATGAQQPYSPGRTEEPTATTGARPDDPIGRIVRDERPWGAFERYTLNEPCTVKVLTVEPGGTLSLQRHAHRDEMWVVLDDGAVVEVDGRRSEPGVDARVFIPAGSTHRLSSAGPRVRVLEIAFGHFDEDDIERLDDAYGRD